MRSRIGLLFTILVAVCSVVSADNSRTWYLEGLDGGLLCNLTLYRGYLTMSTGRYSYFVKSKRIESDQIRYDQRHDCYYLDGAIASTWRCGKLDDKNRLLTFKYVDAKGCPVTMTWRECGDGYVEAPCPTMPHD